MTAPGLQGGEESRAGCREREGPAARVWFGSPVQTIKGQAAERIVLLSLVFFFFFFPPQFPWLLFKAVSLRTGILYAGGRLRARVGGWVFVWRGF